MSNTGKNPHSDLSMLIYLTVTPQIPKAHATLNSAQCQT